VKAWELVGETETPDGHAMRLMMRDGEYLILVDGSTLMSSRTHGSEDALATAIGRHTSSVTRPSVLVGGLGMGFTLRATLTLLPADAIVTVAELVPAVVKWNQGPLASLAGVPLKDPRVRIVVEDVATTLRTHPDEFDAIALDVDNGPTAFTTSTNQDLYANASIASAYAALGASGVLAVWAASEERAFARRLRLQGFTVRVERVRARLEKGGARHFIYLGLKASRTRDHTD
jgi:spermidine synthase